MYLTLKHCSYQETFKVLEFGAGEGTMQLASLLKHKKIPFEYHTFENDEDYIFEMEDVHFHKYELSGDIWPARSEWEREVETLKLSDLPVFDLIIVDGPHGISRAKWYAKFNCGRAGNPLPLGGG